MVRPAVAVPQLSGTASWWADTGLEGLACVRPVRLHEDPESGEDLFPIVHLGRGYDSGKPRDLLEVLGSAGEIAVKGVPAPIQPDGGGRSSARTRG